LSNEKEIFSKIGNTTECLGGGTIHHTNFGAYALRTNCTTSYNVKEMYIIDHNTNKMYWLHKNKFCFPEKEISTEYKKISLKRYQKQIQKRTVIFL